MKVDIINSGYPEGWHNLVGEWSSEFWKRLSFSWYNFKKWREHG